MRIRLVGGTGLVRSAIQARLSAEGPECVLVSRHPPAPNTHHITLGVDVIVNAAGALQERDMQAVHVAGSAARGQSRVRSHWMSRQAVAGPGPGLAESRASFIVCGARTVGAD
jgi:NAD dependent epimerase/dehydratase family enzyme